MVSLLYKKALELYQALLIHIIHLIYSSSSVARYASISLKSSSLISLNKDTVGLSLQEIFGTDLDKITSIQTYDNQMKEWRNYHRDVPSWLNTLNTIDQTMGIWVNVDSTVLITINGNTILSNTVIDLYAGWNLVGYPSEAVRSANDVLAGTGFDMIQRYNSGATYLISDMPATDNMLPGCAYWIHVPTDTSYIVTF